MTTFDHAPETMHDASHPVLVARVANSVSKFLRAWKNRRAIYHLGEMSDAELADIGLTRGDLSVAIDLPYGSDPTAHLGSVADARVRRIDDMARQVA
jgi:uncharacterized protein YjiS (DUF1127 family)